ncbi:hypothetical protein PFISCL1PPCAC_20008, partial [Pristionchus fissidentatus]
QLYSQSHLMMSTAEKPGFLSKLFGRTVSRPTISSDSTPSSSSNGSSSPAASKPLRYLSPTAIESSFARIPSRSTEPTADLARKRPLGSPQATTSLSNGNFYLSDTAKRFRGNANTSLVAEPVSRLELPKLDTTWSAGMGLGSPSNLSYSPCSSIRSIRSRITRPSSRTSVLSSKTAALLGQIERDARRMPMLRVGLSKERWNSLGSSSSNNVPPVSRLSTVPSRYQVMSSFLSPMQKKPYWRDVARERTDLVQEDQRTALDMIPSQPPKNRTENGGKNGVKSPPVAPTYQPVLKGSDGQNINRGRNTFSANEISNNDTDLDALSTVKNLNDFQFKFALPTKGFLAKDVKASFSFKKPIKVTEIIEESETSEESESESSASTDSGSGDDECDNKKEKTAEKTSDTSSSAENTSKETSNDETKKVIPFTSNFTLTAPSKQPMEVGDPNKIPSPVAATKKWDCTMCFVLNDESSAACIACTAPRTVDIPPPATGSWSCKECFVSNNATAMKCIACSNPKPGLPPSDTASTWNCPVCCVPNKAVDVKCLCCGEMNPIAPSTSVSSSIPTQTNVFGDKAFKPVAAPSGIKFGFGGGSTSSVIQSPLSFGIQSKDTDTKLSTTGFVFGTKPENVPSVPPSITVTAPTPIATTTNASATPGLFGAGSSNLGTTGVFSFGSKAPSANGGALSSAPSSSLIPSPPVAEATAPKTDSKSAFNLISGTSSTIAPATSLFAPIVAVVPSTNLLGSSMGGSSAPSMPAVSSTSLFGSSSSSLFGASVPISTTSSISVFGGLPAATTAPSASTPAVTSLPFTFGTTKPETTKMPVFGALTESKPLFGGMKPSEDDGPGAKKAMFGTGSSTPFASFGQTSNTGNSNMFGSTPAFGSLTQSASAPSFSAPIDPPSSFNFGSEPVSTAPPPTTFSFGSLSSSPAPFMFGQQSTTAATPFATGASSITAFGAAPALPFAPPPAVDGTNPFAFNAGSSSGARKMISAKRRLGGKK